jgi:hypothetical protein
MQVNPKYTDLLKEPFGELIKENDVARKKSNHSSKGQIK